MSTNTHKSWHVHREVNREKARRLQDELNAAKDRSAKGLDDVLSGETVSTTELLKQIHKLGDSSPLDSTISNSINPPVPAAAAAALNDELSRFDPLLYPIEPDLPAEEPPLKKHYQNHIKREGLFNTHNDKSTISTAANRPDGQRKRRTQDGLVKKFCGSLPHPGHEFGRDGQRCPTHSASHNTHSTKHAAIACKSSLERTRS